MFRASCSTPRGLRLAGDPRAGTPRSHVRHGRPAASLCGMILALIGFVYASLIEALAITTGFPLVGWASLMVAILITPGAQLLMVGIVGAYIWRVLDEARLRPLFIVESTVNCDAGSTMAKKSRNARPLEPGGR